jgi:pimeloyl-ACP methyl ester carboxylesterase
MSLEKVSSADGATIAIERRGQGKPLLVIHGAASSRQRWFLTAGALAEGRQLILMDRRARGDSTDGGPYSIEREFEDVVAVVAHIGERLDILGHSYGAMLTLGAAPHLQRVDRIILYEPPLNRVSPDADLADRVDEHVARGDLEGGLRAFLSHVGVTEAEVARLRELPNWQARLAIVPTIPREIRAARDLWFEPDYLARISTPILLLLGSDSPRRFGEAIETLAEGLPNARVEILAGQKHQAMDTAPALFVNAVRTFLAGSAARG